MNALDKKEKAAVRATGVRTSGRQAAKNPQQEAVGLWIDTYSEIFSDFDPRPFPERALSDDFIAQVKKVSRDARGKVTVLRILVPQDIRREEEERIIRRRLENYFYNGHSQLIEEQRATRMKGLLFSLLGLVFMSTASYIYYLKLPQFYPNLFLVLLEPAGWFLMWTGLDDLFTWARSRKGDLAFYKRMADVHVEFGAY